MVREYGADETSLISSEVEYMGLHCHVLDLRI